MNADSRASSRVNSSWPYSPGQPSNQPACLPMSSQQATTTTYDVNQLGCLLIILGLTIPGGVSAAKINLLLLN